MFTVRWTVLLDDRAAGGRARITGAFKNKWRFGVLVKGIPPVLISLCSRNMLTDRNFAIQAARGVAADD